jgi:hypothetical protein
MTESRAMLDSKAIKIELLRRMTFLTTFYDSHEDCKHCAVPIKKGKLMLALFILSPLRGDIQEGT